MRAGIPAFAQTNARSDVFFQINYVNGLYANGDAALNFVNDGAGAASDGAIASSSSASSSTICVNVYEFDPAGAFLGCCACPLAPNALLTLSVRTDPAPGVALGNSVVVKVLSTVGPWCGTPGEPSGGPAIGLLAWATSLKKVGTASSVVESAFRNGTVS